MCMKSTACMSKRSGKPLTEYHSEYEALEAAEYSNINYGNDLVPYKCSKCNQWHLTPKSRRTPSRKCEYCTDSVGRGKELYETEKAAELRAEILREEQGVWLRVYECPCDNGWHLTKSI